MPCHGFGSSLTAALVSVFAFIYVTLQMFVSYATYARYLKWLTLVLLAYVALLFVAGVDGLAAAKSLVMPTFTLNGDRYTVIVAILGTTISPYLLFWQSSREVEEIEQDPKAKALVKGAWSADRFLLGRSHTGLVLECRGQRVCRRTNNGRHDGRRQPPAIR